jgi:two-component system response regulator HydG
LSSENSVQNRRTILIVDDDQSMRSTMQIIVESAGLRALVAETGEQALELARLNAIDLVLLDIQLPDMSGMQVLKRLRASDPQVGVIMVTVVKETASVVEAIKLGAMDYLTKDFGPSELAARLTNALSHLEMERELARRRASAEADDVLPVIVGPSPLMREVVQTARRVATLPTTVLITGESGTGKETLACFIHQISDRKHGPFVPIDLSAMSLDFVERTLFGVELPDRKTMGRFELADKGTIFLDEVAALTPQSQARLLRVVQEGEVDRLGGSKSVKVDLRVICATRADLLSMVKAGKFREDLYYRLAVQPIQLPPLHERTEDIPALATYFLSEFASKYRRPARQLSADALEALAQHDWPGNVRELENLMERLSISSDTETVSAGDLPEEFRRLKAGAEQREPTLTEAVAAFEADQITRALKKTHGDRRAAAALLGVGYSTIRTKIRQYGLEKKTF